MASIAQSAQALTIGGVVQHYGVSFDQLRYWDRLGILVPGRVGNQRVYYREHLEQLVWIQRQMAEGWTPMKIKIYLQLESIEKPPSHPTTRALENAIRTARKGDVVREPLLSKAAYNTTFVRIRRKVQQLYPGKKVGRGRDVEIRLSDDERFLEAHFLK